MSGKTLKKLATKGLIEKARPTQKARPAFDQLPERVAGRKKAPTLIERVSSKTDGARSMCSKGEIRFTVKQVTGHWWRVLRNGMVFSTHQSEAAAKIAMKKAKEL